MLTSMYHNTIRLFMARVLCTICYDFTAISGACAIVIDEAARLAILFHRVQNMNDRASERVRASEEEKKFFYLFYIFSFGCQQ